MSLWEAALWGGVGGLCAAVIVKLLNKRKPP